MTKRYISPQNDPVDIKTDKDSHYHSQEHTKPAGVQNEAYTPTTEEVSLHYAAHRLVTLEGNDNDLPTSYVVRRLDQVYGPEFDRWLRIVKAQAWDEGWVGGACTHGQHPRESNPYESEEA
jgi:hypothetical protein